MSQSRGYSPRATSPSRRPASSRPSSRPRSRTAASPRAASPRASNSRAASPRAASPRASNSRASNSRAANSRAANSRAADSQVDVLPDMLDAVPAFTDPVDTAVYEAMMDLQRQLHAAHGSRVTCGVTAATAWRRFTGQNMRALDESTARTFTAPSAKVRVFAVGLTFTGTVDHQLVLVRTPARVHTLQAFFPAIRRPHYFTASWDQVQGAIKTVTTRKGGLWDDSYSQAFNILTRIRRAYLDATGGRHHIFLSDKKPAQMKALAERTGRDIMSVGGTYIAGRQGRPTPGVKVVVAPCVGF